MKYAPKCEEKCVVIVSNNAQSDTCSLPGKSPTFYITNQFCRVRYIERLLYTAHKTARPCIHVQVRKFCRILFSRDFQEKFLLLPKVENGGARIFS
jgi:hypothetical protein